MPTATNDEKVQACIMAFGFGLIIFLVSTSRIDREMEEFAKSGVRMSVPRSRYLAQDCCGQLYYESIYDYVIAGKKRHYVEHYYPNSRYSNPSQETIVLTYLPESPAKVIKGVPEWEQSRKAGSFIGSGVMAVALLLFGVIHGRKRG